MRLGRAAEVGQSDVTTLLPATSQDLHTRRALRRSPASRREKTCLRQAVFPAGAGKGTRGDDARTAAPGLAAFSRSSPGASCSVRAVFCFRNDRNRQATRCAGGLEPLA